MTGPVRIQSLVSLGFVVGLLTTATMVPAAEVPSSAVADENGECYISGDDLARWRSFSDLVIVDVRPAEEFRRVRIPGSINLPAFALKTKTYLTRKHVLLIDRAGRGAELEAVCQRLRAEGFAAVAILEGGLGFWSREVGGLAGDPAARRALYRISPADLSGEARRWLVVDVSAAGTAASSELPAPMLRIPFEDGPSFRAALQRAVGDGDRPKAATFVLLTDQRGDTYESLEPELQALDMRHVYLLDGGLEGYRRFRQQRDQIVDAAGRGCTLNKCGR